MTIAAGKVMMDRNCPEQLCETATESYGKSQQLIDRWHGVKRLNYAVTPRFAPTSTEQQLEFALGDDRCTSATHLMGEKAYQRDH